MKNILVLLIGMLLLSGYIYGETARDFSESPPGIEMSADAISVDAVEFTFTQSDINFLAPYNVRPIENVNKDLYDSEAKTMAMTEENNGYNYSEVLTMFSAFSEVINTTTKDALFNNSIAFPMLC